MNLKPSTKIYLGASTIVNAGRGIFATKNIKEKEIIEECPIILLEEEHVPHIRKTLLHNYYFMWGEDKTHHKAAICLGFGSLYNHSYTPNATYMKDKEKNLITFVALKQILKDEEITVNYNYGNPDNKSTLWIPEIPPAD